ncbi:MAG: hypothetical protein ACI9K1_002740, partial [Arcticibacterium sp.]
YSYFNHIQKWWLLVLSFFINRLQGLHKATTNIDT